MSTDYTAWQIFKKGGTNTLFRISQPPMHILEMLFLGKIAPTNPQALAAGGITFTFKNFLVHTPGAFLHLLPIKFDENSKPNSANLFYAAYITVTGLNTLVLPIMIFSGNILTGVFNIDPTISENVQGFFSAFAWGSYPIQWFSINRQFMNSLCGDKTHHQHDENYKFMMPIVGGFELAIYATTAYCLITGAGNAPLLGNAGSGYAFSISAWFAFLASSAGLLLKKSFREYLLQHPERERILNNIRMILRDHAPIALRFLIESTNLITLAILAEKISEDSLTAFQLCTTVLLPVAGPCFSFIHGTRALLKDSLDFRKTALISLLIPSIYAGLYLIPLSIPPVIRWVSELFLSQHSPESREAIKNIVQSTAPIMAATEITVCAALQERTLETWGAQRHEGKDTRYVAKENWIITGKTFALQSALFLPLAYAIGLKLDYGLPGMAGVYLLCMLALLLALAPRTINFLRNPSKPPHDCFFPYKPDYLPTRTSSTPGLNTENDSERLRLM